MTRARHDAALSQEATRLRALGYSWEQAYTMAEIMLLVRDAGFLAMTSDDYERLLESKHAA